MTSAVPGAPEASQRLFVALWPDTEVRAQLTDVVAALPLAGGRKVAPANLHLTLAFLGAADAGRRACIEQALSAVRERPFVLAFGVLRYRRRSAMVWLEAHDVPPALQRLVITIDQTLADCGYASAPRAFRAHVTLARNVRRLGAPPAGIACAWPVRDFCLVRSHLAREGAAYTVLRRWPLAA